MTSLGPRLVIAGTHSGVGKTTIATGLMAALTRRGLRVGAGKVGPDFIDPSYHRLAVGRPSRSLDEFLSGEDLLAPIAADAAAGCDLLVVEGVMGMFDGSGQPGCDGSTASVARALDAPVILVVDVGAMSQSVAAIVHGFASLDPRQTLAGVVLNRVASDGHATMLREALEPTGIPVLGVVPHDQNLAWRERHLGLVPVAEQPDSVRSSIDRLAVIMSDALDLDGLVAIARSAPSRPVGELPQPRRQAECRIAVCGGPAFSFVYPENTRAFELAGAELVHFDPLSDEQLPDGCTGLYVGGGFPEVFADALAANGALLAELRTRVGVDLVTWAECGGYMWLAESLDGRPMSGVLPGVRVGMDQRLTLGYRWATTRADSFLGPAGSVLRGHEFHYSTADPAGDGLEFSSRFGSSVGGHLGPRLFASYLHQHLLATPKLAERFVAASAAVRLPASADVK